SDVCSSDLTLPESAAITRTRDALFHGAAQRSRQLRENAEALRQERFEPFAKPTGQYGRLAAAADPDDDRRTIHDRRHDETRQIAVIDDVDRHVAALGLTCHARVDGVLIRR